MGHADASMAGVYREGINPARVKAVCEYVRNQYLSASPTTLVEVGEVK
jgi:hypothetical protein